MHVQLLLKHLVCENHRGKSWEPNDHTSYVVGKTKSGHRNRESKLTFQQFSIVFSMDLLSCLL